MSSSYENSLVEYNPESLSLIEYNLESLYGSWRGVIKLHISKNN